MLGCNGQIGRALGEALIGSGNEVVGIDRSAPTSTDALPFTRLIKEDVGRNSRMAAIIRQFDPQWVFHLPAIMSGAAESKATETLRVNVDSQIAMLQLARRCNFALFCPSTIGVFGRTTPKLAADSEIREPRFLYGITKVYNELIGEYWFSKFGVDYRSLRLPGIVAPNASAGTGTTGKPFLSSPSSA